MKNKSIFSLLLIVLLVVLVWNCSQLQKVTDIVTQPSAREIYQREFENQKAVFQNWENQFKNAQLDSTEVLLPYAEKGKFYPNSNQVYTFNLFLQEGTIFSAEVKKDSTKQRVFIDLFKLQDSVNELVESNKIKETKLTYTPKSNGYYQLIIQPEINADTPFFISLVEHPVYAFPVAGKGNAAIQSFWGNPRDGGKRSHEGIDIFAERGTPVVAAVKGRISRTGNRGLGGKQVWLREGLFGNSLYYAHLDSVIAKTGQQVKPGDTLGLVGNTGNARTTPPHLHFGIYSGGAKNPLPFVFKTETLNADSFPQKFNASALIVSSAKANLRKGPDTSSDKIFEAKKNDTLQLLGEHKNWLHIQYAEKQAFIHNSLVREVSEGE
jgi:murein DD-endopeptidase MepM/ murein hydrolase activator NlpD